MKSSPSAYLNVALRVSIQRGTSSTSSCSTLTHSTGPMPSGNGNDSGPLNGSVVCQSPFSQMTGGFRHSSIVVQMLNTGAKAKPGISRSPPSRTWTSCTSSKSCFAACAAKTSVRPGSIPIPTSASLPARLPRLVHRELLVAELHARQLERPIGVRLRKAAGHVHVVRIGLEGAGEDRHHELRIDRVHDQVRPMGAGQLGHRCRVAGVDLDRPGSARRHRVVGQGACARSRS